MKTANKLIVAAIVASTTSVALAKDDFTLCYSHYTGWEPVAYAGEYGVLDRWAKKEGISIKVELVNDYIESLNLFTNGHCDAVTSTNMDALALPAAGGVDTTVVVIGDTSNGNDAIVMKNGQTVADLVGRDVHMVDLSVSLYMTARALQEHGKSLQDIKVINTSDADIPALFETEENAAVATWNPPLQSVMNSKGAVKVFDSSMIPNEILDMIIARTDGDERFNRAMAGAWYETMDVMSSRTTAGEEAIAFMAKNAGGTLAEFKAQLKTTGMYYTPEQALNVATSPNMKTTMDHIRNFSYEVGMFGPMISSADAIGIELTDGSVLGDGNNVKLRFTDKYMKQARAE